MALAVVSLIKRGSLGVADAIRDLLDCLPIPEDTFPPIRSPTSGEPSIGKLPDNILVSEIFSRLGTTQEVARARCVCRRWKELLSASSFGEVWHRKRSCRELWMMWGRKGRYGYARVEEGGGLGLGKNWTLQVKRCQGWPEIEDMNPLATSHGLVCASSSSWFYEDKKGPNIFVGNPRTSTWKHLPPLPSFPPYRSSAHLYSVRFLSHRLLSHTYSIFFQIFNPFDFSHPFHTFFYHSTSQSTPSWTPLHRLPLPPHRLRAGLVDSSVSVVDYHVLADSQTDDHRAKVTVFDSDSNTWDELEIGVQHPNTHAGTRSHNFIRFVSLSARCKDRYSRLISIDENMSLSLWELDVDQTDVATFRHLSSSGREAAAYASSTSNSARYAADSSEEFIHELFYGALQARAYIIRSDEEVFMAMMTLGGGSRSSKQFLLVSYDVVRSIWYLNIRKDVRGCRRSTSFLPASKREKFLWSSLLYPNPDQHSYIQDVIPDPSLWSSP